MNLKKRLPSLIEVRKTIEKFQSDFGEDDIISIYEDREDAYSPMERVIHNLDKAIELLEKEV